MFYKMLVGLVLLLEKVIEYTEAQAKGRRLRMARALTGMSRQDLHDKTGIATSTMDTWESGRVELNERSSVRVCESFRKLGVFCSSEWLLYGKGMPPHLMSETEKSMLSHENKFEYECTGALKNKTLIFPPFLDADIKKELSFFLNLHKGAVFLIVKQKFLNSQFEVGDCVAGVKDDPQNLIGEIVILQNFDDKLFLCRLNSVSDNTANVFFNSKHSTEKVVFKQMAKVLWHRKSSRT